MAHSDPISDLLTRLRNGVRAKHRFIDLYSSRMTLDLLRVLEKLGFIEHILVNEEIVKPASSCVMQKRVSLYSKD